MKIPSLKTSEKVTELRREFQNQEAAPVESLSASSVGGILVPIFAIKINTMGREKWWFESTFVSILIC